MHDPGGGDRHQRRRAHHHQQYQRRQGQREASPERIGAGAPQGGATTRTARRHAGDEWRQDLEHPAAGTFTQLAPGRWLAHRRSIVASPSASWPTAALIAATSPDTSEVGCGTTMRKLRVTGALRRRSNTTAACAASTTLPAASASSRWTLSSTVASELTETAPLSA